MTQSLKRRLCSTSRRVGPARASTRTLSLLVLAMAAGLAAAAPLDDIRRQVEGSQFEQAYRTGQANPQLIGDVHFDFLYGVAAINVGRIPEGLLALERHLSAVPANDRARLELARGYFLIGEYTRARSEFEFVLRYNPPTGVRSNINGFLQAMQARESSDRRASARLYAEVGGGFDNNVNGGTYRDTYQLGQQIFSPETASRAARDSFAQVTLGGQHLMRVSGRMSVFAGGDFDHRGHAQETAYDVTSANVYAGFSQLSGPALWRATLSTGQLLVGNNRYRNTNQITTEANLSLAQDQTLMFFGQYGQLKHAAAIDSDRDGRLTTLGAMFTHNLSGVGGSPTLGVRASYTRDDNQALRKDFSKQGPQVRVFASVSPMQRMRVSAGLTGATQTYGAPDAIYPAGDPNATRKDRAASADLVANFAVDAQWSIRGEASWSVSDSNQDLYDSNRKSLSVKLRYQF